MDARVTVEAQDDRRKLLLRPLDPNERRVFFPQRMTMPRLDRWLGTKLGVDHLNYRTDMGYDAVIVGIVNDGLILPVKNGAMVLDIVLTPLRIAGLIEQSFFHGSERAFFELQTMLREDQRRRSDEEPLFFDPHEEHEINNI